MATRFKKILDISMVVLFACLLVVPSARSVTLTGGRLVEDFSTDTYADYTSSTGLWDIVNNRARAGVVVGAVASQTVTFGDGSDGDLDSSGAVTFDTNSKPNGYNYRSVRLRTGAVVTVTGTNTLIIRSLTTFVVDAGVTFNLNGSAATAGVTAAVAATATGGSAGASAATCQAVGGAGGDATGLIASNGSNGSYGVGVGGTGGGSHDDNGGAGSGVSAGPAATLPDNTAFYTTGFICGSGGGGGGANTSGTNNGSASGGGGGGGGGRIRITAVGNLTITSTLSALGGDSGAGGSGGALCAGNGGGGGGGAIWLQALGTIVSATDVTGGVGAVNACDGLGTSGDPGAVAEHHAGAGIGADQTTNAAASQTYEVLSKGYDLDTLNAVFSGASVTSSAAGGGSAAVTYAGSKDGATYSSFVSDITQLNNKNYRFMKFKIAITTAGAAAVSPHVSQVAIDFKDGGLDKLELKFSPGCGTIAGLGGGDGGGPGSMPMVGLLGWSLFWLASYRFLRFSRRTPG